MTVRSGVSAVYRVFMTAVKVDCVRATDYSDCCDRALCECSAVVTAVLFMCFLY